MASMSSDNNKYIDNKDQCADPAEQAFIASLIASPEPLEKLLPGEGLFQSD